MKLEEIEIVTGVVAERVLCQLPFRFFLLLLPHAALLLPLVAPLHLLQAVVEVFFHVAVIRHVVQVFFVEVFVSSLAKISSSAEVQVQLEMFVQVSFVQRAVRVGLLLEVNEGEVLVVWLRRSVEHFDVLDFSEFGETSHEVVEVVVVVILLRESAHVKYATLRLR